MQSLTTDKPNGCGPGWLGDGVKDDVFTEPCNKHDKGTADKDQPLMEVHGEFYEDMVDVADSNPGKWWLPVKAMVYFVIVVLLGWISRYLEIWGLN